MKTFSVILAIAIILFFAINIALIVDCYKEHTKSKKQKNNPLPDLKSMPSTSENSDKENAEADFVKRLLALKEGDSIFHVNIFKDYLVVDENPIFKGTLETVRVHTINGKVEEIFIGITHGMQCHYIIRPSKNNSIDDEWFLTEHEALEYYKKMVNNAIVQFNDNIRKITNDPFYGLICSANKGYSKSVEDFYKQQKESEKQN